MIFGIGIPLRVVDDSDNPPIDLFGSVEELAEALADLEDCKPELLDSSLAADRSKGMVLVDVSIQAETIGAALDIALSCVRSAIHTTGANTPGWETTKWVSAIAYGEYTSREIAPV